MITKERFIHAVRDELKLPLVNPDLEHDFDQKVHWRSMHRVRLFAALERLTGRKVPVRRLFEQTTVSGVYQLYTEPIEEEQPA
ncbi:acyl carrier protein [Micromonospora sp. NPDC048871]|uniref:acyl carrier protein n=1 Tax=unclassified Micromonospora TaxID=2617518 RepID=UPI002E0F1D08|nr:acyl carrier protein [Micromonospora sp. NBC_01739]